MNRGTVQTPPSCCDQKVLTPPGQPMGPVMTLSAPSSVVAGPPHEGSAAGPPLGGAALDEPVATVVPVSAGLQPVRIPADNATETEIVAIAAHFVRTSRPYWFAVRVPLPRRDGDSRPRCRTGLGRRAELLSGGLPSRRSGRAAGRREACPTRVGSEV